MRRHTILFLSCITALVLTTPTFAATAAPTTAATQATDSIGALLDAQTQRSVVNNPELRTMLGISGDGIDLSGQLTDVSLPRRAELRTMLQENLAQLEQRAKSVPVTDQDRWSLGLARWFYQRQIEMMAYDWSPAWLPAGATTYAVDQLFSIPVTLPQFMENQHVVKDEASALAYISRLHAIGSKLDQVRANFDMQAAHGVVPPQTALEGAAAQIRSLIQPPVASSRFVVALAHKLDKLTLPAGRREQLIAQAEAAVQADTNPGYARLLARLEEVIATHPGDHGMWALPDGDAYYDAALRWNTSTDLDADEIHRIGLSEVARIQQRMDQLLRAQGMDQGTVGERMAQLVKDPRFQYDDSDAGHAQVVADIEHALAKLKPQVPNYFGRVPPQPLEVRMVPADAQATAPGAYYLPPALDGSRGGLFFINLGNRESNTRWSLPTLTYHEGSPGHHFQISIGQTLSDLPLLRRSLNPSAFTEGWALYAEQLAAEMGLYQDDPWGDIGRLRAELFRSVRLVVDTGLHRKRWTPEQAIDYMHAQTGMSLAEVRTEIYRYLVQPGQACSYKVGHLKMVELRERARSELGERFDIRAFHDLILGNGAMPLAVLEAAVDDWIATVKAQPAG
ncbi:DUF885 domain-containing protein [Pseudoxanthomonas dokdonensis]|uniref:DUF885 domain-containing protein n=1 Tax=Pseudoxanthomonas dokdonensis TaxID=344882 RepID=A0A0R0CF84_9GAMM|nr:DUF885 domain-containing protein [Pseudoxanthomonas dokdonensis]KRG68415.1 hypothetical protein ABB29_12965 [Pseudoxanthomonas dokdonensis]